MTLTDWMMASPEAWDMVKWNRKVTLKAIVPVKLLSCWYCYG